MGDKPRNSNHKSNNSRGYKGSNPEALMANLIKMMETCQTAEALNDQVIMPFALALEKICSSRGYLMNIYGENSNMVVSNAEDAETLYHLIEEYFETSEADDVPAIDLD